jgi:predicted  nucleic acid-binding Zn-ribbon protein
MKTRAILSLAFVIVMAGAPLRAQHRSDPLTQDEIDLLRDSAVEPEPRMKLYVQFARARLVKLEQMRADPKVKDRPAQTHQMLEDFLSVYNELNDNLDNFEGRKADLRKAMRFVIEGDTEFQAKLRALKDDVNASKEDVSEYQFILSDALETVDNSTADHRKLQADEEEIWKRKKKTKS